MSLLIRREAAIVAQVPVALIRHTRADVGRDVDLTGARHRSAVNAARKYLAHVLAAHAFGGSFA